MWRETTLLTDRAVQFASAKNLRLFLTQCNVWEVSVLNQSKHGKARKMFFLEARFFFFLRIGSDRRGTNGIRVDKFLRIHHIGNSRRDPEENDF